MFGSSFVPPVGFFKWTYGKSCPWRLSALAQGEDTFFTGVDAWSGRIMQGITKSSSLDPSRCLGMVSWFRSEGLECFCGDDQTSHIVFGSRHTVASESDILAGSSTDRAWISFPARIKDYACWELMQRSALAWWSAYSEPPRLGLRLPSNAVHHEWLFFVLTASTLQNSSCKSPLRVMIHDRNSPKRSGRWEWNGISTRGPSKQPLIARSQLFVSLKNEAVSCNYLQHIPSE